MTAPDRIYAWPSLIAKWLCGGWSQTRFQDDAVAYVPATDLADALDLLAKRDKAHEKELAVWSENYAALERKLSEALAGHKFWENRENEAVIRAEAAEAEVARLRTAQGAAEDSDPPCTDCDDTGFTHQTERWCTCNMGQELSIYARADAAEAKLQDIDALLMEGQGDDDGPQIMPDFADDDSTEAKVEACLHLLEKRRDVIEALTKRTLVLETEMSNQVAGKLAAEAEVARLRTAQGAAGVLLADLSNHEEHDVFAVAQDAFDEGEDGPHVLFSALRALTTPHDGGTT